MKQISIVLLITLTTVLIMYYQRNTFIIGGEWLSGLVVMLLLQFKKDFKKVLTVDYQ